MNNCFKCNKMRSLNQKTLSLLVVGFFFLVTIIIWAPLLSGKTSGQLEMHVLDVGQGSAMLLITPSGHTVLIDGGAHTGVVRELGKHLAFWDRHIDTIVATHPDADHIGGLVPVLERYRVRHVYRPGVEAASDTATAFTSAIQASGAEEVLARRGQQLNFGDGAVLTFLFPDRNLESVSPNDASVIGKVTFGETSLLFTGDAPERVEEYLVLLQDPLESDILLVGHHGSDTSSSELFLGSVAAEHAVVSRGCNNRFGHPHESVIARLVQFEMRVYDTCTDGGVSFYSDGVEVVVEN